jgi:hypothetical protein
VDWDSASLDFQPNGSINAASFKTSITRMKGEYSLLSTSDKSRVAASFAAIKTPADLKSVMGNVRITICPLSLSSSVHSADPVSLDRLAPGHRGLQNGGKCKEHYQRIVQDLHLAPL